MPEQIALVTGATGAIGPIVVGALCEAGLRVRTFSLDAPAPGDLPDGVEVICGDITNRTAVRDTLNGVDYVIHMAALLHINNPAPALRAQYQKVNVEGTRCVTKLAQEQGVRRIVLFSTINVYGPTDGKVVNEEVPLRPDTLYARTKREAEDIALSAQGPHGQRLCTVLRLGAVYGSRVKGNYRRLAQTLGAGRGLPLAGTNRRTLIYDHDVGRAVLAVLKSPKAEGQVYNVTDGTTHTVREIIGAICLALDRPTPRFFLPVLPARLAVRAGFRLFKSLKIKAPEQVAVLYKYFEDIAADGSKIQIETGFRPQFDLERGWRDAIRLMREAGDL